MHSIYNGSCVASCKGKYANAMQKRRFGTVVMCNGASTFLHQPFHLCPKSTISFYICANPTSIHQSITIDRGIGRELWYQQYSDSAMLARSCAPSINISIGATTPSGIKYDHCWLHVTPYEKLDYVVTQQCKYRHVHTGMGYKRTYLGLELNMQMGQIWSTTYKYQDIS